MNKKELIEMLDYICRDGYFAKELEDIKKSIKDDYIEKQKIEKKINFIQGLYNTQEEPIEIAYQQQWIVDTTALLEELLEGE